ncbi:MAG: xanthine dehydrogenase small subunit, partial [Verrucomicrobiota bacterium]|nr:xanthine dehydrogenase small subunit [Verrucomicrobiota bacterium]
MDGAIEFRLNGKSVRVADVSPNITLLEWLRASGLTGSKEGCAEGDCGACSVAIVDRDAQGKSCYRAINSCLVPLPLMAGRDIVTVEGVANGKPHPVQSAMVENHGSQCGYCTPGFIMSLFEGYHREDLKTKAQLQEQLCGNLCRCTGYRAIYEAAVEAFAQRSDRMPLNSETRELEAVFYARNGETFLRPGSLPELFKLMADYPSSRLIAGGTELGLEISKRFRKFETLISLEAVAELREITRDKHKWTVGAATTLTQLEDKLGKEFPALGEMLRWFGSRQIRNRATLGGNLVTASPIGDCAPVLLALDAKVVIASANNERVLPIDEFFISYRKTALASNEILKAVIVPATGRRQKFYKVSKRREMDISTVAAGFVIELDPDNVVTHIRIAYGGVALTPLRARKTEQALLGKKWNSETIAAALTILQSEFAPISDVRGSAGYRQQLIASLFEKFFRDDSARESSSIESAAPPARRPRPHESAHKHVTGEAIYVDDATGGQRMLEVWPVCSPHAHAKILRRDATAARGMRGVAAVLLAEDVPGLNDVGAVRHDEILLADRDVFYHGHIVALV